MQKERTRACALVLFQLDSIPTKIFVISRDPLGIIPFLLRPIVDTAHWTLLRSTGLCGLKWLLPLHVWYFNHLQLVCNTRTNVSLCYTFPLNLERICLPPSKDIIPGPKVPFVRLDHLREILPQTVLFCMD